MWHHVDSGSAWVSYTTTRTNERMRLDSKAGSEDESRLRGAVSIDENI
jgi:hypothetical protein